MAKKSVSQLVEEDLQQLRQDEYRDALSAARARKEAKAQQAEAHVIVDEISDVLREHKIDPNTKQGFRRFVQLIGRRVMSAASGGGYARTLSGEEDELDFSKKRSW
ncbi:MAG: hypothetical protein LAP86_06565 [Acidobacteriia bacterium]|nr:hypothetical protein [Terriglobia bacterium]